MIAAITGNLHPSGIRVRVGWLAYLLIGLALTGSAVAAVRPWGEIIWMLMQAAALVAAVVGIRRHRPAVATAWWLLVAALAVTVTGSVLFLTGHPTAAISVISMSYPVSAAALLVLGARLGGRPGAGVLDACIVMVGAAIPAWTLLTQPALSRGGNPLLTVAFPVLDLAMLWLTARLVIGGAGRSPAHLMLVVGNVALLAGDCEYLYQRAHGATDIVGDGFSMGMWLVWSTFVGAAALHPSIRRLTFGAPAPRAGNGRVRLAAFLTLALVGPATAAFGYATATDRADETMADHVVVPVLTAILAVLLVVRLDVVARLANRRATALDRQAAELCTALREQEALQHQLSHRTMHDPLTGLANRVLLGERLEQALSTEDDDRRPALLLLDLDGFKDVNDTFGHPVGDELLVEVADRLQATIGSDDVLARLGGDEFAILLPDGEPERASRGAGRARHAAHAVPVGRQRAVPDHEHRPARQRAPTPPRRQSAARRRPGPVRGEGRRPQPLARFEHGCAATGSTTPGSPRACGGPSRATSSRCTTSPSSTSAPVRPTPSRRCCAGRRRVSRSCRRTSSSRPPRRPV